MEKWTSHRRKSGCCEWSLGYALQGHSKFSVFNFNIFHFFKLRNIFHSFFFFFLCKVFLILYTITLFFVHDSPCEQRCVCVTLGRSTPASSRLRHCVLLCHTAPEINITAAFSKVSSLISLHNSSYTFSIASLKSTNNNREIKFASKYPHWQSYNHNNKERKKNRTRIKMFCAIALWITWELIFPTSAESTASTTSQQRGALLRDRKLRRRRVVVGSSTSYRQASSWLFS